MILCYPLSIIRASTINFAGIGAIGSSRKPEEPTLILIVLPKIFGKALGASARL